jgi:predicted dithiol-disulfide oxidoreductase (DUF899 family)
VDGRADGIPHEGKGIHQYHFMFGPTDGQGCPHCSFWADHFDGVGVHLNHRDVTMVAISRAPLARIRTEIESSIEVRE